MNNETKEIFPLSKTKSIRGSRRLAREKVLQILIAIDVCETDSEVLFHHIFYRDFNLGEDETKHDKFLRPEDVVEIESDIPVKWKNDEVEFGKALLENTIKNQKYIDDLLKIFADNWELERIANIDRKLMHMAITELMDFDQIPPKVSINESIEIAKNYSTDKSSVFINGVLDSVLEKLKADGKIAKSGRGLKDY
jgi:transcription antitermination factor NusB